DLSRPEGPHTKRVTLSQRRGATEDLLDNPRRQGVPAEPSQGDRETVPRLRVRGRTRAGRAVPGVPGHGQTPPGEHERSHPEAGERAPSGRDRDAGKGAADPFEVMGGCSMAKIGR